MISTYLTYASISALVACTPGPSNYIAAYNGAKSGVYKAAVAITGHMSAVLLLAFLAAIGLSTFIMNSPPLFTGIKLLGAGYLFYIGYGIFMSSRSDSSNDNAPLEASQKASRKRHLWQQHFFVAATNPKAMIFFTALFPQFINPQQNLLSQFAPLAMISLCSSFFFPFVYALIGHNANKLNVSNQFIRGFNFCIGLIFMGLSIMLAIK